MSPALFYHIKGRNYGMLSFCISSKEIEPFIWKHSTYFDYFIVKEKQNLKTSLVLLTVFKTTKVAVIDSYLVYMDTKNIDHLLLGHTHIKKKKLGGACGAKQHRQLI